MLQAKRANGTDFACPCCTRDFATEAELEAFDDQMKILMGEGSPLLRLDERNKSARSNYQQWRESVSANMNDVLDYKRTANEINDLEKNLTELESVLESKTNAHQDAQDKCSTLEMEVGELRELLETTKRCREDATRVSEKRMQVNQKQLDLSMSNADIGGRDLKTVETEMAERMETKDKYSSQVRSERQNIKIMSLVSASISLCSRRLFS